MTMDKLNPLIGENAEKYMGEVFGEFDFTSVVQTITDGKFAPDSENIINRLISLFLGELKTAFALVGSIAAIIMISSFVNNLNRSFGKNSVNEAAGMALYVYIAAITAAAFESAAGYVLSVLGDVMVFLHGIIPAITTLGISGGEVVTATMAHPVVFFICNAAGIIIRNVVTPLVLLRAVSVLLCAVTNNDSLNEFSDLFKRLHKTVLAFSMSIFAGILGITSFAAASFDSLAARGVKFAISASVPVVGGSLAEAMSSVAGSSLLLRNAVGLGGVIGIFAMFAIPLLKIWALSLAFRLTAAFTAPISEKRVTEILRRIGDCIDMLFSSIACMGTIMIIALAAIL